MEHLLGSWKTILPRAMWTMEPQLKGFQRETIFANWAKDLSCDSLARNMATICLCPKNLPEAKLKSFGLISLVEEIPRYPSIDCGMWLLVITLMLVYRKKEQVGQRDTKCIL